jgi:hypothetical protein
MGAEGQQAINSAGGRFNESVAIVGRLRSLRRPIGHIDNSIAWVKRQHIRLMAAI